MKKALKSLFLCLLTVLIGSLVSCDAPKNPNLKKEQQEIATVKRALTILEDPQCKSSEEFINNVLTEREKRRCTEVLNTLSLTEINEMCKVIIHREGFVTRKLFLKEYDESYQRVYKYLEKPKSANTTMPDTIISLKSGNDNILTVTKHEHGTKNVSSDVQREQHSR